LFRSLAPTARHQPHAEQAHTEQRERTGLRHRRGHRAEYIIGLVIAGRIRAALALDREQIKLRDAPGSEQVGSGPESRPAVDYAGVRPGARGTRPRVAGRAVRNVVRDQREVLDRVVAEGDPEARNFLEVGVFRTVEQQPQLQHIDDAGRAERETQHLALDTRAEPVDLIVALALHTRSRADAGNILDANVAGRSA